MEPSIGPATPFASTTLSIASEASEGNIDFSNLYASLLHGAWLDGTYRPDTSE